ncbi:hypothetical protein Aple_028260 [Acrocarpospora pleiomorpha]|uniref:DUF2029 domain-containing protein n=1 Tax=Acrocarpospora pleiomorpha TaxID=90975 RepID=A0A5M3XFW0_9ACTN|nr:glycosyltransferase 87 family protein [Acrocarpospora pleiomorpha]GES19930.1 hypothetical protein Aple_028260 [Acrocarpospora pleiomorpha]
MVRGAALTRTAALIMALVAVLAGTVRFASVDLFGWYVAAWALFAAAAWSLRGVPARQATALVLAGGIAVVATGLLAPPRTSTDSYRYAWDGRVQAAGVSPYDHTPADPALAALRDPWLFPTGDACREPGHAPLPTGGCTRLNRPTAHTIYPPVAEAYFLLVHALSPPGARHKPLQVGGALLSICVTIALLRRRPGHAAYWAWCPAVPLEAVNNAHADVLGVLLTVLAFLVVRRRRALGGALLGSGIAVKLLPAVTLPGALSGVLSRDRPSRDRLSRDQWFRDTLTVVAPAAAVAALAYLPYVLASHASVFGYLTGYVREEGYDDASARDRYALVRLVVPDGWALPVVAALLLVVTLLVLRHGDPDRPWRGALLVTGAAFLLLTPGYSWYALLLVALVALDGRWEWLGIPLAGAAKYLTAGSAIGGATGTIAYGLAALAVIGGYAWRTGVGSPRLLDRTAER